MVQAMNEQFKTMQENQRRLEEEIAQLRQQLPDVADGASSSAATSHQKRKLPDAEGDPLTANFLHNKAPRPSAPQAVPGATHAESARVRAAAVDRKRQSMPACLNQFSHIDARDGQPKAHWGHTGFRLPIHPDVDVSDLGFSSMVKDGCTQLKKGTVAKLGVPSALHAILHVSCLAHNHLAANERKSHLTNPSRIKDIHKDITKLDRHLKIPSLAPQTCVEMLTKWRHTYHKAAFADTMETYYKHTGGATPRTTANLIDPASAENPATNNSGKCHICLAQRVCTQPVWVKWLCMWLWCGLCLEYLTPVAVFMTSCVCGCV